MKKNQLNVLISVLIILTFVLGACTPAATQAPAAEPTKAPAAEPTKAPAAEPTKAPAAASGDVAPAEHSRSLKTKSL